jgi:hypothetical protein
MSTHEGAEDDVELNVKFDLSITQLALAVRAQLIRDSRRLGNLYGSTAAQKKTPLASKPQNPGTQRVW